MTSNRRLATILAVPRRQVIRWRHRGLTVEDPVHLLAELADQRNPGRTLRRLSNVDRVATILSKLTTN